MTLSIITLELGVCIIRQSLGAALSVNIFLRGRYYRSLVYTGYLVRFCIYKLKAFFLIFRQTGFSY